MTRLNPTGHYVLIKPDEVEEVSREGIILNVDAKRELAAKTRGTVVKVGATAWYAYDYDKPTWKPWAQPGDYVQFVRHAATLVMDPDTEEEYFIIADENILATIEREA